MTNDDESLILSVNGEIYNHKALRKMCAEGTHFKTQSDCEVILHLVRFFLSLEPAWIPCYLVAKCSFVFLNKKQEEAANHILQLPAIVQDHGC